MAIFKDQSAFDIILDTTQDLSSATSVAIEYEKPSGAEGTWTGSVSGTTIVYTVQVGDIDEVGLWRLQAKAVFTLRVSYGRVVEMRVNERLTTL